VVSSASTARRSDSEKSAQPSGQPSALSHPTPGSNAQPVIASRKKRASLRNEVRRAAPDSVEPPISIVK